MSRELQFDGYWEGEAVYTCDNCHKARMKFRFDSEEIDSRGHRAEMRRNGWKAPTEVEGRLFDFCCERCRNEYIRKNTF